MSDRNALTTRAIMVNRVRGYLMFDHNEEVSVSLDDGYKGLIHKSQVVYLDLLDRVRLLDHLTERMSALQEENKWDQSLEVGLIIGEINSGRYDVTSDMLGESNE